MSFDFSFHAQVAAEAIEKVGRLFNASIDDILNELLQNARRAGATKVVIDQITDPRFGEAVRICDNGAGLTDPRALFSLGHSGWSESLSRSEDAAGMGFFALANRGATIIAAQTDTANSWSIEATPDAFHGRHPVNVRPGPEGHAGVTIVFPAVKNENLAGVVRHAARFFPLPVELNGEPMPESDFLDGADHVEEWRGIRIGVFERNPTQRTYDNANFHGVTLRMPLPSLQQSWHRSYCARIDVVDCAHFKLVLPARKEVVRNAMYEALLEEINRLYFRLVAAAGPHSLAFAEFRRGRELGIDLKEADQLLRPFVPALAEAERNEFRPPKPVPPNAHLYEGDGPVEEQNVARAIAQAADAPSIFEPNNAYAGYGWYDRLHWISLKNYRLSVAAIVEEIDPDGLFKEQGRPDRLEISLDVNDSETSRSWLLETDLIVTGPDYNSLGELDIRVTSQSTITPAELQVFLTDAVFSYSDDVDAGSYDQQQQWFSDEAEDLSISLLQSEAAADLNAIVRIVERELVWRVPREGTFVIRIDDRKVSVDGLLSAGNAGAPAPL